MLAPTPTHAADPDIAIVGGGIAGGALAAAAARTGLRVLLLSCDVPTIGVEHGANQPNQIATAWT